jgi:zinc/manganese transport system ATP-binding protein
MPISKSVIIKASNLTAGYKNTAVWQDASFAIYRGEFIGLLGPNGAGKSTLMSLILGLRKPISGKLRVFGEEPRKGSPRIGYVPQRREIDSESKIEAIEYVRLGLSFDKIGFSSPREATSERAVAMEALKIVDGSDLANRPLSQLSGGEQQKIFLAQALVSRPDILLLDEPLSNLDIRRSHQLIRLIKKVAGDHKITVILIAHDINPLLPVVDRIIYIANQKVASGTLQEVVTSEGLSALYEAPIEVLRDSKGRVAVLGIEEALHHDEG